MFKNFKEKTFSEKIIRILTIITLVIGIVAAIKSCNDSKEKSTNPEIINSGNNSTIINGNGNTINKNNIIINEKKPEKNNSDSKKLNIKQSSQIESKELNNEKKKIVILPFEYLSDDKKYQWLSKAFSETLIEPILNTDKYIVLEGTLRDKLLSEIDFQQGKYVDIKNAVKIGKILGANEIIYGSYQINDTKIKIVSRIVDVESAKIIENSSVDYEDSILEPFKMQKNYSEFFIKKIF